MAFFENFWLTTLKNSSYLMNHSHLKSTWIEFEPQRIRSCKQHEHERIRRLEHVPIRLADVVVWVGRQHEQYEREVE